MLSGISNFLKFVWSENSTSNLTYSASLGKQFKGIPIQTTPELGEKIIIEDRHTLLFKKENESFISFSASVNGSRIEDKDVTSVYVYFPDVSFKLSNINDSLIQTDPSNRQDNLLFEDVINVENDKGATLFLYMYAYTGKIEDEAHKCGDLLKQIADRYKPEVVLNLVAHSIGCVFLADALRHVDNKTKQFNIHLLNPLLSTASLMFKDVSNMTPFISMKYYLDKFKIAALVDKSIGYTLRCCVVRDDEGRSDETNYSLTLEAYHQILRHVSSRSHADIQFVDFTNGPEQKRWSSVLNENNQATVPITGLADSKEQRQSANTLILFCVVLTAIAIATLAFLVGVYAPSGTSDDNTGSTIAPTTSTTTKEEHAQEDPEPASYRPKNRRRRSTPKKKHRGGTSRPRRSRK